MDQAEKTPLVSYILLAYRQEHLVGKSIESALAQTYPNLEIIISDDCSPDGTWEAIRRAVDGYTGPHRIVLNRMPRNVGVVAHFNALFAKARGAYVFNAGGDDVAHPERVSRTMEAFLAHPDAAMVGTEYDTVDAEGRCGLPRDHRNTGRIVRYPYESVEALYKTFPRFCGAMLAYRRDVFDRFGPMDENCWVEDLPMGLRAALLGSIWWIESPLVHYRIQGGVSTSTARSLAPVVRRASGTLACYRQMLRDVETLEDPAHAALRARIARDVAVCGCWVAALTAPWPWPSVCAGVSCFFRGRESRGSRRRALFMSLVPRFLRPAFYRLLRARFGRRA